MRDRRFIIASAALRAAAVGLSGVIISLHLALIGFNAWLVGVAISLGLAGCAVGTWLVTLAADRLGRRVTLALLAILMALGGLTLIVTSRTGLVLATVLLGMVNGMGRDRGAGTTVEQAILPQTVAPEHRTTAFAWYNLAVDLGHAVGSLFAGLPALFRLAMGIAPLGSYQLTWAIYALLCFGSAWAAWQLSPAIEFRGPLASTQLSPSSKRVVAKFAMLSGLDSLGGGFLTTALLSYWFFRRFGIDEGLLGPLFFVVRIANGLSHLGAAWIARRIGLVKTMVFTHLPSSLLLMTVPFAPNLPVAVLLFLLRESFVEMDVPTRQSYIVAVVDEEERTRAAGITNLTRSTAWAIAPAVAGSLMRSLSLSAPLIIGPGLKILYDLLLYRAFRRVQPPEERRVSQESNAQDGV